MRKKYLVFILAAVFAASCGAGGVWGEEWDAVYEGGLPREPWMRVQPSAAEGVVEEEAGGALFIADRGEESGDYLFYEYRWDPLTGASITAEARVKVKSGWSSLIISDGFNSDRLVFHPDRIEIWSSRENRLEMDTTVKFRDYRVEVEGRDIMVYVDGELCIEGKGLFTRPDPRPDTGHAAFGGANSEGLGEAYWRDVKVRVTNGLPEPPPRGPSVSGRLRVESRAERAEYPSGPVYPEAEGKRLVNRSISMVSEDNGRTWHSYRPEPDFREGLPYGYRRSPCSSVVDPNTGRFITILNARDTEGVDPSENYTHRSSLPRYLRYAVSEDGARTWLLEKPMVQKGYTPEKPFEGVHIGKNALTLGDAGNVPIVTREGKVLVPAQSPRLGPEGEVYMPGGSLFRMVYDVLVLVGTWAEDGRLEWVSRRVKGDPEVSTRGFFEPTLAEFPDGRILMVMRGSNSGDFDLPSYKWFSVSEDGGMEWSEPRPWTYEDGENFHSPSSMSRLINHSGAGVFWIGNISEENCRGNSPRHPAVMGEVCPETLMLVRDSVVELDGRGAGDMDRGRLDLSHFSVFEDRRTREFVITYSRAYQSYQEREPYIIRVSVREP